MSESLTIETEESVRRSRVERPDREVHREREVAIEETPTGIDPEAALAESRAKLEQKDRDLVEARRQAREADNRRLAAERQVHDANTARATDRVSVVAQAIESAKADETAAEMALRQARELGDIDAEIAANKRLSSATYRLNQSSAEFEWLKSQKPQETQQRQDGPVVGERARKWIADHPRFETDEAYRAVAEGAHNIALRKGMAAESDAYFDYINGKIAETFPDERGETGQRSNGERRMNGGETPGRRADTSPPPSRGNGSQAGWRSVKTGLGTLLVQDRANGARGIRFADKSAEENFREGAQLNSRLHEKDPDAALKDYCNEMIQAHDEGWSDLKTGDGERFA